MLPNVYPKKLKPIVPDGNCLFRCFSFIFFSAENEPLYLRKFYLPKHALINFYSCSFWHTVCQKTSATVYRNIFQKKK